MISTLRTSFFFVALVAITTFPGFVSAQNAVSLSVSPTLFEMTANPSQEWSSDVRVINTNDFPLKVYLNAVNFEPSGESGQGTMVPVFKAETEGSTLAEWISVPTDEIIIPAEQTVSIPFSISVPENAAPGGHFAAILVGTRSLTENNAPAQVETSQVVSSLVFLSVSGDIVERGMIRDFTTTSFLTETPTAQFSLRFENSGNVHLQPQGDISITNMWGKERGLIPINQTSQFGNVLPNSIRQYSFEWTGDWSFADIGRYTAVTTLAYGDDTRQFVSATTSFWVIPWKAILAVLIIVGGLLSVIIWGIKQYIRRMLQIAGVTPELARQGVAKPRVSITAPLEEGILDLRSELISGEGTLLQKLSIIGEKYRVFIVVALAVLVFVVLFVWYLVLALTSERGYEVKYEQDGTMVPVIDTSNKNADRSDPIVANRPEVTVVNRSGIAGLDQLKALDLQSKGYRTDVGRGDAITVEDRTVIVYNPEFAQDAVDLQQYFPDSLLSSFISEDPGENPITVYLGTDQI